MTVKLPEQVIDIGKGLPDLDVTVCVGPSEVAEIVAAEMGRRGFVLKDHPVPASHTEGRDEDMEFCFDGMEFKTPMSKLVAGARGFV